MQAYGEGFARIYNLRWGGFANEVAPRFRDFYAHTVAGQTGGAVLDLCCGTGQLARHFLEHGYRVTGLDLSPAMLHYARQNTCAALATGQARFVHGDAADFTLEERFGLVVSTYDALNHLPDLESLQRCCHSVAAVLLEDGWFIFDLNTRLGLRRWGGVSVQDSEELFLISRGVVLEAEGRAYTQISGFLRQEDGRYERFDETVFNTMFELSAVCDALSAAGFRRAHCARLQALTLPLDNPEREARVFVVAQK